MRGDSARDGLGLVSSLWADASEAQPAVVAPIVAHLGAGILPAEVFQVRFVPANLAASTLSVHTSD